MPIIRQVRFVRTGRASRGVLRGLRGERGWEVEGQGHSVKAHEDAHPGGQLPPRECPRREEAEAHLERQRASLSRAQARLVVSQTQVAAQQDALRQAVRPCWWQTGAHLGHHSSPIGLPPGSEGGAGGGSGGSVLPAIPSRRRGSRAPSDEGIGIGGRGTGEVALLVFSWRQLPRCVMRGVGLQSWSEEERELRRRCQEERAELLASVERLSGGAGGGEAVYLKELRLWGSERAVRATTPTPLTPNPQPPTLLPASCSCWPRPSVTL